MRLETQILRLTSLQPNQASLLKPGTFSFPDPPCESRFDKLTTPKFIKESLFTNAFKYHLACYKLNFALFERPFLCKHNLYICIHSVHVYLKVCIIWQTRGPAFIGAADKQSLVVEQFLRWRFDRSQYDTCTVQCTSWLGWPYLVKIQVCLSKGQDASVGSSRFVSKVNPLSVLQSCNPMFLWLPGFT